MCAENEIGFGEKSDALFVDGMWFYSRKFKFTVQMYFIVHSMIIFFQHGAFYKIVGAEPVVLREEPIAPELLAAAVKGILFSLSEMF